MKDETKIWIQYARENLRAALLLLETDLHNPCLQNIQQCIEKALKAVLIEKDYGIKRTHSISELKNILESLDIRINLSDDDCDFFDSIYLPSKYPVYSVLPDFSPNVEICRKAVNIGQNLFEQVEDIVK